MWQQAHKLQAGKPRGFKHRYYTIQPTTELEPLNSTITTGLLLLNVFHNPDTSSLSLSPTNTFNIPR